MSARGGVKAKSTKAATAASTAAPSATASTAQRLPSTVAARMGSALGRDVSDVAVHTDARANALARRHDVRALAWGRNVAFAAGEYAPTTTLGQLLLAHELAHTAQQAAVSRETDAIDPDVLPLSRDAVLERGADAAALAAIARLRGSTVPAMPIAPVGALTLSGCSSTNHVDEALRGREAWTSALAEQAVQGFESASAADRQTFITTYAGFGQLGPMLAALPAGSTGPGGRYESSVRSLLQLVQRTGARTDAASQGLATQGDMAQAQATEMITRNQAAAAAAQPASAPPPTTAQVAAQQTAQVASHSIATQSATMSAATETTLNASLNTTAIPAFVTWCSTAHPTLSITAANLRADARAVFMRGANVLAFADTGAPAGVLRAVVGENFGLAVAANPAYALPVVVHELWGHNTYGPYASPGTEFGLELYDQSAALMPGYTRPAAGTADRRSEIDAYAYQETEMYSWMRMIPFYTPTAAAHASLTGINHDPVPQVSARIGIIKSQWEPRVARSLVRGLWQRFRIDPTLAPSALTAFRDGVRANFSATDAAAILA